MREGLSLSWNSTISIYKQYLFIFWTPLFMAHSQTLWLCTDSVRPGVLIVLSESTMQEVSFLNIISEALRVLFPWDSEFWELRKTKDFEELKQLKSQIPNAKQLQLVVSAEASHVLHGLQAQRDEKAWNGRLTTVTVAMWQPMCSCSDCGCVTSGLIRRRPCGGYSKCSGMRAPFKMLMFMEKDDH